MDDGVDLSSHLMFSHTEISHGFDEFLKNTTSFAHTHTCNPPGPSAAMHTHTFLNTHKLFMASSGEHTDTVKEEMRKPRKPLGNREAVRKYREKKKAHAVFLEEEIKKLRATNQQLLRRLQGHVALEAEVVRLRGLLFDIRGKIDAEIDTFPCQKHCNAGPVICTDPIRCFNTNNPEVATVKESSGPTVLDCKVDESGIISRELGIPKVPNSMDAVACLANLSSLAE
ncbi:hypothetical protein ACP70R_038501 [Stipagrostis hirtigluma subsp. patula]